MGAVFCITYLEQGAVLKGTGDLKDEEIRPLMQHTSEVNSNHFGGCTSLKAVDALVYSIGMTTT